MPSQSLAVHRLEEPMSPHAPRSRGIGRGLAAILAVSETVDGEVDELRELPVELIAPNPRQPRRHFDQQALAGLADSLGARGVLQPVLVRPRHGRDLRADRR